MANREQIKRIDAQWQALQPQWSEKDYEGERKMLHDALDSGEAIEVLLECGWDAHSEGVQLENHERGIVVATGSGVFLLNRGRLSKNISGFTYLGIDAREAGPGKVRIREPLITYNLALEAGAATEFASFLRERIPTDSGSMEQALASILRPGESVEHWAAGATGQEEVVKHRSHPQYGGETYDEVVAVEMPALAIATDQRFLVRDTSGTVVNSWPHGTILAVECWGGTTVRLVDSSSEVHVLRFRNESDATPFVSLMRAHEASVGRRMFRENRISAQWKLQHPLWSHRNNHGGERRKLAEVLANGEQIEAMVWGTYQDRESGEYPHDGIIAATRQRLLFVSNGWGDKNVSQLPYEGVAGLAHVASQDGLGITAAPGYAGYIITNVDKMDPRDSRKKEGQVEEFTARLQTLVDTARFHTVTGADDAPPDRPVPAAASGADLRAKRQRIDQAWTERSKGWALGDYFNERESIHEILDDDEDIERLMHGYWKEDIRGQEDEWGVLAATDRRLLYVYNGKNGARLAELPYNAVKSVRCKKGLIDCRITIAASDHSDWVVTNVSNGEGGRFADCVRNQVAGATSDMGSPRRDAVGVDKLAPPQEPVDLASLPDPAIPTQEEFDWTKRS